jgi:hypothetical protein
MDTFEIRPGWEPEPDQWYKVKFYGGWRDGQIAPIPGPVMFFDGYRLMLNEDGTYIYIWSGGI